MSKNRIDFDKYHKIGAGQRKILTFLYEGKRVFWQRYTILYASSYYLSDETGKEVLKRGDTCFKASVLSLLKRKLIKEKKTTKPCFDVEIVEYELAEELHLY